MAFNDKSRFIFIQKLPEFRGLDVDLEKREAAC